MSKPSRRVPRRRRRVFNVSGPEQLETRRMLTSEISGVVFYDTNEDGNHDEAETGVPGVLVTLTGTTTDGGDSVTRRYLTEADGSYVFADLEPGTYEVVEAQPVSIGDGLERTDADVTVGNDSYSNIEVTDDADVTGLNFGEGTLDPELISPIWLLASSGRESFRRDMRATLEEEAGNTEFADAIRNGETEVESDFDLNGTPTSANDSYTVDAGETLTITAADGLLANDSDPAGDDLTAVVVEGPANGSLNLDADGSFTYEPDAGFIGSDSFTYSANDGFRDSVPSTVTIQVGNPNTFSVSASAVENDLVGAVQPLTEIDEAVVFEIAGTTTDERLQLRPDDHVSGTSDASVVLIEYLDFACSACQAFHESDTADFLRLSPGDYLTVYRYLPLSNFTARFNIEAAQAAEAASRQGLFIEMMDQLFDNQGEWTTAADSAAAIELFEQYGQEINGFDLAQFRSDFADPAILDRINRDADTAEALGIVATPTFVLDGEITRSADLSIASLQSALAEAEQRPFKINRFTDDTDTAGDLMIFNTNAVTTDGSPLTVDVIARTTSGAETIRVDVNVTE